MEEVLYWKTAPLRVASGYKPVPVKYKAPAVICRSCGLDGHRTTRCEEENWSDDDGDMVQPSES
jgi:hypothetical protein